MGRHLPHVLWRHQPCSGFSIATLTPVVALVTALVTRHQPCSGFSIATLLPAGGRSIDRHVAATATPTMQRLQHCDRDRKSSSDLRPLRAGFRALSFAAASDWCDGITPPPSGKPTPAVFLGRRRPTAPLPPARTGRPASAAGAAELLCAARSASARIFFAALISRSRTRPQLVQWCVRCARVFGTSAPQPEQRCEVWRGSTSTSRALSRSAL